MVEVNSPVVFAAAAVFLAATIWMLQRKKKRTGWVKVGDVGKLFVYPLKSIRGMSVPRAEVTSVGLKYKHLRDRSFAVVHADTGKHVNPKIECYHLTAIGVEKAKGAAENVAMTLTAPAMIPFTLDIEKSKSSIRPIKIFDFDMTAWDMGDEVAIWLHRFLEKESPGTGESSKYRLVLYDDSDNQVRTSRDRPKPYIHLAHADDKILFPDFTALHLVCEASLDDLNDKLKEGGQDTTSPSFFRNNIFVKNSNPPFSEDSWKYLKIGDTVLRVVKSTHRCMLATIDPETGVRNPKTEPLRTLRKYRLATNKQEREWFKDAPLMGINIAVDQGGEISVGDEVYAIM